MFKSLYHFKYEEDVVELGDMVSALILPEDEKLFDQRMTLLELRVVLQKIAKEKPSLKIPTMNNLSGYVRAESLFNGEKERDRVSSGNLKGGRDAPSAQLRIMEPLPAISSPLFVKDNIAPSMIEENAFPGGHSNLNISDRILDRNMSRGLLSSKIGKIMMKNSVIEQNPEAIVQNVSQQILTSMRDMKGKGLPIHERSYELPGKDESNRHLPIAPVTPIIPKLDSLTSDGAFKSFKFENKKVLEKNIEEIRNRMKKIQNAGLEDNFIMKSRYTSGRPVYIIQKKTPSQKPGTLILEQKNFLFCPDIISLEYRSVEDLGFVFMEANYFETKDPEDVYFYFRVLVENSRQNTDMYYVIKMLDIDIISKKRWDPVFYVMQEIRLFGKYFHTPKENDGLLHLVDYFVDYDPSRPESHPKFFLIYDDFHSNLRDLMEYRRAKKLLYTEHTIMKILVDMVSAVYSLHRIGIAHRNIRAENVFFNHTENTFKLGGLGLAVVSESPFMEMRDLVGTPFYMAIDIFTHFTIKEGKLVFACNIFKNDIYALGALMAELLMLQLDISEMVNSKFVYRLCKIESIDNILDFLRLGEDKLKHHYLLMRVVEDCMAESLISERLGKLLKDMLDADYIRRLDIYGVRNAISSILDGDHGSQSLSKTMNSNATGRKGNSHFQPNISVHQSETNHNFKEPSERLIAVNRPIDQDGTRLTVNNRKESVGGANMSSYNSRDNSDNSPISELSVNQRLKRVIFGGKKGRRSGLSPMHNDLNISTDIMKVSLVHCTRLKVDYILDKNEFGLFEILMIAIFLSLVNLQEQADKVFQQVQNFYTSRTISDETLLVTLMICRIKNMSKMSMNKGVMQIIDQLTTFCKSKQIKDNYLTADIHAIRSRAHYCSNQIADSFRCIASGLHLCSSMGEGSENYIRQFILTIAKMMFSFKRFSMGMKVILQLEAKRKSRAVKSRGNYVIQKDEIELEFESLKIKLHYKMKKYSEATEVFENLHTKFMLDNVNQTMGASGPTVIEIYSYGIQSYLKMNDSLRALQIHEDFLSIIEYNFEDNKLFYGLACCLKGLIMLARGANSKLISRYASGASRKNNPIHMDTVESGSILVSKLLIKLYKLMSKEKEIETTSSACIKQIETSYCPHHMLTFDFYVSKLESLLARQKYSDADKECEGLAEQFEVLEEFQSETQILSMMKAKFDIMMYLGMLDSLDQFLKVKKIKYSKNPFCLKSPALDGLMDKVQELLDQKKVVVLEEIDSNRDDFRTLQRTLTLQINKRQVEYNLLKRDYRSAVLFAKLILEEREGMPTSMEFDLMLTIGKALVKGAKHGFSTFEDAFYTFNELITYVNSTQDVSQKVKGMCVVSMYLFYTGDPQKSLEYLFQAMCYLETRPAAETLAQAWDIVSLKIRVLNHIAKFIDQGSGERVSRSLLEYMIKSTKLLAELFDELDSKSKNFNNMIRVKNRYLISKAFLRIGQVDYAQDNLDVCRARIIEINNGEFCFLSLVIRKTYAKLLLQMESYHDAYDEAKSVLEKVNSMSAHDNNKFIREKVIKLIREIILQGKLEDERQHFVETEKLPVEFTQQEVEVIDEST